MQNVILKGEGRSLEEPVKVDRADQRVEWGRGSMVEREIFNFTVIGSNPIVPRRKEANLVKWYHSSLPSYY